MTRIRQALSILFVALLAVPAAEASAPSASSASWDPQGRSARSLAVRDGLPDPDIRLRSEGSIVIDALHDREIDALSVANRLEVLGRIRIMDGRAAVGAVLFGVADRIFEEAGGSVTGTSARAHEAARARALHILGTEAFDSALEEGNSLSLEEAVARALADAPSSIAR